MKKFLLTILTVLTATQLYAFEQDKYYTINRNGEQGSYIYASDSQMKTGTLVANDGLYVWQFIPTGNPDCYYIKNVATETYIQSSKIAESTLVQLGTEPVEYVVSRGAGTTGSGTTYFLASNDQGEINYKEDATMGLNKGANGVVAYFIKTGRGNSYWEINETKYSADGNVEPDVEDEDACPAIAAYRLPCGTYSAKTRLTKINITGEGVLSELRYAPTTTGRYTLYTQERAVLMQSGEVTLNAEILGSEEEGLVVTIWADFDGDGVFEKSVKPTVAQQMEAKFTVPAVVTQKGRFRIRIDQSGAETANADFIGTLYDFPFSIKKAQTKRTLSVTSNNEERGTVSIEGQSTTEMECDYGANVTVVAELKDGFYFHGWRKGRTIVSSDLSFTTKMTENKELVAVFATTEGIPVEIDDDTYPVNFPKNSAPTRTDRKLNAVSITPAEKEKQTCAVNASRVYINLTRDEKNYFHCEAGETLAPEFDYTGTWMHGYVYIDENHDKQFSFAEGNIDQSNTEVKSYSFYSGDPNSSSSGQNSVGEQFSGTAINTLRCPPFIAPEKPGDYRIRFKVDWNSVDAGGRLATDGTTTGINGIFANAGFIVDAVLRVAESTGIQNITTERTTTIHRIDGRCIQTKSADRLEKGIYIINGEKRLIK